MAERTQRIGPLPKYKISQIKLNPLTAFLHPVNDSIGTLAD